MKTAVVQAGKYGWYEFENATNDDMKMFAIFLIDEGKAFKRFFESLSSDDFYDIMTGNFFQIIWRGESIYLSTIFDDFDRDDSERALPTRVSYEFTASLEEFLKALEEWEKIDARRPRHKEVIIQQDDEGRITFQTSF